MEVACVDVFKTCGFLGPFSPSGILPKLEDALMLMVMVPVGASCTVHASLTSTGLQSA